jgi:tetratricopeptide (TPR) repeat protein
MESTKIRSCFALVGFLLAGTAAQAGPVSLHPRQDKLPAQQLEDRAPKAGGFPLLDCLNSLVRGDTAKAEVSCSEALARDSHEHDAYKLRGYAYLIDHRFERAGADFQAAVRLRPRDDQDHAGLAQSFSGQGLFGQAVSEYRVAVTLAPGKAAYWSALCWARAGSGRQLHQALAECNRALALQPGAPAALNSRGFVYLRLRQFDRAIADYNVSLTAGPLQASARFGRGLARLNLNMLAAGAADISEARRRDGDIDHLFVTLGVLSVACADKHVACPPGFPARPAKPDAPAHLMAHLMVKAD